MVRAGCGGGGGVEPPDEDEPPQAIKSELVRRSAASERRCKISGLMRRGVRRIQKLATVFVLVEPLVLAILVIEDDVDTGNVIAGMNRDRVALQGIVKG
jgi:hypothetical protein